MNGGLQGVGHGVGVTATRPRLGPHTASLQSFNLEVRDSSGKIIGDKVSYGAVNPDLSSKSGKITVSLLDRENVVKTMTITLVKYDSKKPLQGKELERFIETAMKTASEQKVLDPSVMGGIKISTDKPHTFKVIKENINIIEWFMRLFVPDRVDKKFSVTFEVLAEPVAPLSPDASKQGGLPLSTAGQNPPRQAARSPTDPLTDGSSQIQSAKLDFAEALKRALVEKNFSDELPKESKFPVKFNNPSNQTTLEMSKVPPGGIMPQARYSNALFSTDKKFAQTEFEKLGQIYSEMGKSLDCKEPSKNFEVAGHAYEKAGELTSDRQEKIEHFENAAKAYEKAAEKTTNPEEKVKLLEQALDVCGLASMEAGKLSDQDRIEKLSKRYEELEKIIESTKSPSVGTPSTKGLPPHASSPLVSSPPPASVAPSPSSSPKAPSPLASSYHPSAAPSTSSPKKESQQVDAKEAIRLLGMTKDQAALTDLLCAELPKRQKKLSALQTQLSEAGVRSVEITTKKGKKKIVLIKQDPLGRGAFKQCLIAIKLSGKKVGVCKKEVFLVPTELPPNEPDFMHLRAFENDISKSQKYSDRLQGKEGNYFPKCKIVTHSSSKRVLMSPLAEGGELKNHLNELESNSPRQSRYMRQLVHAGKIMEREGLFHRDLKTENVLVTGDDHLRVSDFGCMTDNKNEPGYVGTPGYLPPLSTEGKVEISKQDSFATGIILLEMATAGRFTPEQILKKNAIFHEQQKIAELRAKLEGEPKNPLAEMIAGLVHEDPKQRLTLAEAHVRLGKINNSQLKGCNQDLAKRFELTDVPL